MGLLILTKSCFFKIVTNIHRKNMLALIEADCTMNRVHKGRHLPRRDGTGADPSVEGWSH